MKTGTASITTINEVNNLLSLLTDDIIGLQKLNDEASKTALRDKVRLVDVLEGAKDAMTGLEGSQDAWRRSVVNVTKE